MVLVLVVTGAERSDRLSEIVDLNGVLESSGIVPSGRQCSVGDFPDPVEGAVGGIVGEGGRPAVCGGATVRKIQQTTINYGSRGETSFLPQVRSVGITHYDRCHQLEEDGRWTKASSSSSSNGKMRLKNYRTYAGSSMQGGGTRWWITGGIATKHNVILVRKFFEMIFFFFCV